MTTAAVLIWKGEGGDVNVAGEFNSWTPQPATKSGDGWSFQIDLQPGRYQYKWVVDGNWLADESQPVEVDQSGNKNNVVSIEVQQEIPDHPNEELKPVEVEETVTKTVEINVEQSEEVSGDSDSWERVSEEDCTTSKQSSCNSLVESSKTKVERIFSPTDGFLSAIETLGAKEKHEAYTVYYWDTPDYLLMKEGLWCKQFQNFWLLRKLEKNGVQTIESKKEIEEHLRNLLGYEATLEEFTKKNLCKKIEFPGSSTSWKVEDCDVTHVKEGDLQTVHIRTEDTVTEGLKKIYSISSKLNLSKFHI